jgi:hypothetical protein
MYVTGMQRKKANHPGEFRIVRMPKIQFNSMFQVSSFGEKILLPICS